MTLPESKPLADYLVANVSLLADLLRPKEEPGSFVHALLITLVFFCNY